jgi:CHAT domain-containing protein
LWSVGDRATADLMADFYEGLRDGQGSGAAPPAAPPRMIARGRPPLYWAPFILIGR